MTRAAALAALALALAPAAAARAAAPGGSRCIGPGQEPLVGEMLGGEPAGCRFEGADIDRAAIRARYRCGEQHVAVVLHDGREAQTGAVAAGGFALMGEDGAPEGLVRAVAAQVAARGARFRWLDGCGDGTSGSAPGAGGGDHADRGDRGRRPWTRGDPEADALLEYWKDRALGVRQGRGISFGTRILTRTDVEARLAHARAARPDDGMAQAWAEPGRDDQVPADSALEAAVALQLYAELDAVGAEERRQDYERSLALYLRAERDLPDLVMATLGRAEVLMHLGRDGEARAALEQALAIDRDEPVTSYVAARLLAASDPLSALRYADHAHAVLEEAALTHPRAQTSLAGLRRLSRDQVARLLALAAPGRDWIAPRRAGVLGLLGGLLFALGLLARRRDGERRVG